MLCYAIMSYCTMLCFAIMSYCAMHAVPCYYVMLCHAVLCYYVILCHAVLYYAMLCVLCCYGIIAIYAQLCYAMLFCEVMLFCATLYVILLCYAMPCHAVPYVAPCYRWCAMLWSHFLLYSLIPGISVAPLQVHYRSALDTARILCRSFTPKRHRQLRAKDLPKVPTWRLEPDSNPRPVGRKASNLPMRHHAPHASLR